LQVQSSRDATQPLRPCADASAEEAALGAALQKDTNTRLLRLVLSDGHTEIPAIELSTLHVFRTIPIPGEKLLIKEKAEVRNGAIIMTETCVLPLGGEVQQLKREFLARKNRADVPYQTSAGLEAAPRFQPLRLGNTAASSLSFKPVMCADRGRGGEGVGGGSRGRSGGGSRGRSGGRGYCGGRGSGGRHRLHHRGRGFGGDRVEPSQDFSSH
ncbi:hypothetical protein DQ04_02871030, partial [Trypanosoma grayi]|uniref:hypothetical protein n=1 Tax=Trypanosoma grayi TaxID=71804 RepID=UPI0004F4618D